MNKLPLLFLIFCGYCVHAQNFAVTLGKGKDCKGFNICSITKGVQTEDHQIATKITRKGKKVKLTFLKEGMNDRYFVQYFLKEYFLMDADFELSLEVCQSIGISHYTIEQGKYDIKDLGESIEVVF